MRSTATTAVIAAVMAGGCGDATGPGQGGSYPLSPVGSVDLGAAVTDLTFIGDDVLAASGGNVCFIDGGLAYLLASVSTGSAGLTEVAATADGGYALAADQNRVYRVSNQTYFLQDSLDVAGGLEELVVHDYSGEFWVLLAGGDILTADVGDMSALDTASPGAFDTECALYDADLQSLYRAGAGLQRLSVPELVVQRQVDLPYPSDALAMDDVTGYLLVAMSGGLRAVSSLALGTQIDYGEGAAMAVDVIPGSGVAMAGAGYGIIALDVATGELLADRSTGGRPVLLAVNGDGSRCAAVAESGPTVVQVFGTD